jgi:hypothetical protein
MHEFPKHFFLDDLSVEGEPTIQIVRPQDTSIGHTKVASEALDFIKNVNAIPDKTIILVLAMTAGEFYGPNRNGDGWPEEPMVIGPTTIGPDEVLPVRYKTFETDANVFKHHVNKDIAKRAGEVMKAFYNWDMHRVELLLALDDRKAADTVERIARGEYPAVSMGCFKAGALVTMADGTRKPIENICVGDMVLTHLGNTKRVTETHKRPYHGPIHSIKTPVYPVTESTEKHPFWTASRDAVRKKNSKGTFRWDPDATPDPDWIHAGCLEQDHILFEPIITDTATPDFVDRSFARLFGYYLAEGVVLRNKDREVVAIQLHVNKEDAVLDEIEDLCTAFGTRNAPNISPRPHSDAALVIDIWDPQLAKWCYEHGGGHSRHKRMSYAAMRWDTEMQREILGAYANGDGHGLPTGALSLSTASTSLAWQLVALCHRLGIPPSINNLTHKAGTGFSNKNTYEWVVYIGKQWAQDLRDVCAKIIPAEILAKRNDRFIFDGKIAMPIRTIVSTTEKTDVYNFEVEDDESYVIDGKAVHNCRVKYDVCSICGNKAPTRREYCKHARDLNGFMADGRRKFVWNPFAKFFDISLVRRPADRLGFMMKKVAGFLETLSSAELGEYVERASQKIANLSKLSVIDKILRGEIGAAKDEHGLFQFKNAIAGPAAAASTPIDDGILRQLAQYRPAEMFSSLASMGVVPSLPEFLKLFVWKLDPSASVPAEALQNAVSSLPAIFQLLANSPELIDEISSTKFAEVSSEDVRPFLRDKFAHLQNTRSFSEPYLSRRLVPNVFGESESHTKTAFRGESRDKHQLRPLLGAGSLMYGTYMLSNAEKTGALNESRAMLSLALNYAGQQKVASTPLRDLDIEILASCPFEQVAVKLGEVIYP